MDNNSWHDWPVTDAVFLHYLSRVIYACHSDNGAIIYTSDPAGFDAKDIKWKLLPQTTPW